MMYLVFVAMMALNVASEVLDAFKVVDSSLTQTLNTVDLKNQLIYNSFDKAFLLNQDKVRDWRDKAMAVKKETDTLTRKIQDLKEYLTLESGGLNLSDPENAGTSIDDRPFLVNSKGDTVLITKEDELNTPSEIMITKKRAIGLKEDIEKYKTFLVSQFPENSPIIETLNKALDTPDPKINLKEGGERKTWETTHFENKPLIAVIALLSKIQIDIKDAETNVITNLFGQIDASSFKFDKLSAYVLPKSTYVLQGDVFEAHVFLGAEESTQQPEIYVGNSRLPVVDGKGVYKIQANAEGTFKWGGLIKYKTPEGSYNTYPFESEYQVGRPSVTISPTKMNVLYQGLANPISISVPGIPAGGIRATFTNGRIEQRGSDFIAYPNDLDPNATRTKIEVFATVGGQERSMGSMPFRVKEVPPPMPEVGGKNGGNIRKEDLLVEDGVFAELKDFDFDLKYTVTQFDVTFAGTYVKTYSSLSNRFTKEQKDMFKQLSQGSIIYIDNIKARGDNGVVKDLASITFKIR
jgi:gliding motility-associated protein GldM